MAARDRRASQVLPALLVLLLGLSCAQVSRAQVTLPADGDAVTAASAAAPTSTFTLAAAAAPFEGGVPLTGGITDPELLALFGQLGNDAAANITTVAARFTPGPARGRYTADGTLVAAGPRPTAAAVDEVAAAAVNIAQAGSGKIDNQKCIVANAGQNACLPSPNGRFRQCLQGDANIVLYDGNTPYWASNTVGRVAAGDFPAYFCAQADGNVVAYNKAWRAFWASNTCCRGRPAPMTLFIQNDGNLVMYDARCSPVWATNTLRTAGVAPPCGGGSGPTPPPGPASFQQEVLNLVNNARRQNGLGALSLNNELNTACQRHSDDMRSRNIMSHNMPGLSFGDRLRRDLPSHAGRCSLGENVAQGQTSPVAVVNAWLNSPGHRANILNGGYRSMGIARADPGFWWTQIFSSC